MTTELLKSEATQMLMTRKEEARATICCKNGKCSGICWFSVNSLAKHFRAEQLRLTFDRGIATLGGDFA